MNHSRSYLPHIRRKWEQKGAFGSKADLAARALLKNADTLIPYLQEHLVPKPEPLGSNKDRALKP